MRFRTATPKPGATRYLRYAAIAKVLRLTVNQVQHLCTYTANATTAHDQAAAAAEKLTENQVAVITNEDTMIHMAGYSLAERASMIKQRYPGKSITSSQLRRLYLARGIKRKFIKQEKVIPRHKQGERDA